MENISHSGLEVNLLTDFEILKGKEFIELTFMPEHHNNHDRFAVAGQSFLPGRLAPVTVEHVPRELLRYIERCAICDAIRSNSKTIPLGTRLARVTFRTACEIERCLKSEETSRKNSCCGLQRVQRPK